MANEQHSPLSVPAGSDLTLGYGKALVISGSPPQVNVCTAAGQRIHGFAKSGGKTGTPILVESRVGSRAIAIAGADLSAVVAGTRLKTTVTGTLIAATTADDSDCYLFTGGTAGTNISVVLQFTPKTA